MFVTTTYFKFATKTALFAVFLMIGLLLSASTVFAQGPLECQLTDAEHNIDKVAASADGTHWPGVRKLVCGGIEFGAFCVDALTNTTSEDNGAIYIESADALSCDVQWLILNYPPNLAGLTVEEAGARNGAIWSFTDPPQQITGPAERVNRIQEIINSIPADPCADLPQPPTLSFKPLDTSEKLVDDTFDLILEAKDGNGNPLVGVIIYLSTAFGEGVPATVVTDGNGEATFSISSIAVGLADITATLEQERQTAIKMAALWQQELGLVKTVTDTAQATTQVEWVEATSLSITKEVRIINGPDAENYSFDFTGDLGDFSLIPGETMTFTNLLSGTYNVAEIPASFPDKHWEILSVTCTDQNGQLLLDEDDTVDNYNPSAPLPLQTGQQVHCTYINERDKFEPIWSSIYLPFIIK